MTVGFVEDSTPSLLRQLRSNRLDIAVVGVCAGPQEHDLDGLRQETLLEDDLRVALPRHHPLATRPLVRADELRHNRWIVENAAGLGVCLLPGMAVSSAPAGVRIIRVEDRHWQGGATIAVTNEQRSAEADAAVAALRQQASVGV
ncbi:hypothetical protein GCM10007079_20900 [Nocardiopsis terrae]|uniref:DNA-binding transcriptional LysR family regulator n=1 Tax=Nocardiopsis terrae TaxID=372655 RepID=A0ABR9HH06_9ACTN|nr:DNA-binding transcriptional LysR family regulator [Nocardiopsis terrae]GHC81269.1 hypothetical protein GCM10007079_20900 [Nocardiopsis terrae]